MGRIKLNTKFNLVKDQLQHFPRKNFAALCFFDFFWKGKKIMSFPMQSTIFPWGFCNDDKYDGYKALFFKKVFTNVKEGSLSKEHFIKVSFDIFNCLGRPKDVQFAQWFRGFFKEKVYLSKELLIREKQPCVNNSLEICGYFEHIIQKLVFDLVYSCSEESINKIEKFILESKINDNCNMENMVGMANINFCKHFPAQITINLEDYFSLQELLFLLNCVKELGLDENPFEGGIETSIEEYKEFLLTLMGPGKWEYTNLDIEKLDFSIEELFCFFSFINFLNSPFSEPEDFDLFSPPSKYDTFTELQFPYRYFWYKLKEAVSK